MCRVRIERGGGEGVGRGGEGQRVLDFQLGKRGRRTKANAVNDMTRANTQKLHILSRPDPLLEEKMGTALRGPLRYWEGTEREADRKRLMSE